MMDSSIIGIHNYITLTTWNQMYIHTCRTTLLYSAVLFEVPKITGNSE